MVKSAFINYNSHKKLHVYWHPTAMIALIVEWLPEEKDVLQDYNTHKSDIPSIAILSTSTMNKTWSLTKLTNSRYKLRKNNIFKVKGIVYPFSTS